MNRSNFEFYLVKELNTTEGLDERWPHPCQLVSPDGNWSEMLQYNLSETGGSQDIGMRPFLEEADCNLSMGGEGSEAVASKMLPKEMRFDDDNLVSVIAYTLLFFVAAIGNLTVFVTLFRNRQRKSRVNLFIMHLAIADMIVTFIMMPMEISWHVTVSWNAGDVSCRIMMFWRAFGFYLSSFILVAISLDRYFAIRHPLSLNDADKRGKIMLLFAWLLSTVASVPQVSTTLQLHLQVV